MPAQGMIRTWLVAGLLCNGLQATPAQLLDFIQFLLLHLLDHVQIAQSLICRGLGPAKLILSSLILGLHVIQDILNCLLDLSPTQTNCHKQASYPQVMVLDKAMTATT